MLALPSLQVPSRISLTGNFGQERQQAGDFGYASGMTTRQTLAAFTLGVLFVACPPAQPTCAAGQVLKSGACVAEVTCGNGTTAVDGACVATVRCGAGTTAIDGGCAPDVACGPGTTALNGRCVPDLLCGPATTSMTGRCLPVCAPGTATTDGGCVADVVCGPGTTAMNGRCVPDVTCGPGTRAAGGTCDPDGTVVCTQGTRFDMTSGTCTVDPTACANGTTLVGTRCTPDDQLLMGAADLIEVELADGGLSGTLPTPGLDAGVTFYGCINPTTQTLEDSDAWSITVTAPTVLDIRVDGIGGLAAGFGVVPRDPALLPALANFQRLGINLTGDTSQREVYLPLAGTYALLVADSRTLVLGEPAGGPAACYFGTIRQRPMPVAVTTLPMSQTITDDGRVKVLTITATAANDIIDAIATRTSAVITPAFVSLRGPVFHRAVSYVANSAGTDVPASDVIGGLVSGETVTLVLDAQVNLALQSAPYTLDLAIITARALPTAGTTAMATSRAGATPAAPHRDLNYFAFEVAAPGVLEFNLVPSVPVDLVVVRRDILLPTGAFDVFAEIDGFGSPGRAAFTNEALRFVQPGRYYLVASDPDAMAGATFSFTNTLTPATIAPLMPGVAASNVALSSSGAAFFSLDLTNPVWMEYGISATTNWGVGNTVVLQHYVPTDEGWLRPGSGTGRGHVFPRFSSTQPSVSPFSPRARIHLGEPGEDFLLRVSDSGTPGAGPTFSLLVRERPNVTNLGTLPVATPVMSTITNLVNGAPARFIGIARPGDTFRVVATPVNALSDIRIDRFDVNETATTTIDAVLVGGAETLTLPVGTTPTWVAWSVSNKTLTAPSDVTMVTTATPPRPYVITSGTLPFVDACTGMGAVTLGTNQDDQVLAGQMLPASFSTFRLFGEVVPLTFRVGANGWLSFDTASVSSGAYQNRPIPFASAPNGLIAPFWQDQDSTTLCRKDDATANTVTIQWSGRVYQTAAQVVQYQVVLHSTGALDFIYGPNHTSNGAFDDGDGNGATVGVETLGGAFGQQVHYNQPAVLPNTSRTLTPM